MQNLANQSLKSLYNKDSKSLGKGDNDDLTGDATTRFTDYLKQIDEMNYNTNQAEHNRVRDWQGFSDNFLKTLFLDIMKDFGIENTPVQFVPCGSLARRQASPYSDIDALVIVQNQADVAKVKEAMLGFNTLLTRIYNANNQFFGDPVGLNMANFCGTIEDLKKIMATHAAKEAYIVSALSSRMGFSNNVSENLLEQLKIAISEDKTFAEYLKPTYYYNQAVNKFSGPLNENSFDIKVDIVRPLDFIMQGLRLEFGIQTEDNSELKIQNTLIALVEQKKIDETLAILMLDVHSQAVSLRFAHHAKYKRENDYIQFKTIEETPTEFYKLLDKMAIIRGCFAEKLENMQNTASNHSNNMIKVSNPKEPALLPKDRRSDFSYEKFITETKDSFKGSVAKMSPAINPKRSYAARAGIILTGTLLIGVAITAAVTATVLTGGLAILPAIGIVLGGTLLGGMVISAGTTVVDELVGQQRKLQHNPASDLKSKLPKIRENSEQAQQAYSVEEKGFRTESERLKTLFNTTVNAGTQNAQAIHSQYFKNPDAMKKQAVQPVDNALSLDIKKQDGVEFAQEPSQHLI